MRLLVLVLVILGYTAQAGDERKYPVSAIPEELRKDVNVVFRVDETIFTINSRSTATHKVHQVITILNDNAKRFAQEHIFYDKLSKVTDLKAAVYDAEGSLIRRLKNSEIKDYSAFDGFSLYSDNRIKFVDQTQGTYPYTVEIEYSVELKSLYYVPDFIVLPSERSSVEYSRYQLIFPKELEPRFKVTAIDVAPVKETLSNGMESVSWILKNVKPILYDPHGPDRMEYLPHIDAAPTLFEYDSYAGNMQSWDQFGQWIISLNKGRDVLPEATRQKVKSLTSAAKTDEEKVKILYEYLQSKTRYVSIQLGIGGYQPFEATVVDQTGYGDCKALSNYMVAMLKEIGIKANYTLIRAGENRSKIDESFPSLQFNHAIVSVPNNGDTLWLECTNQSNPFGYQGRFTGDRKALVVTDNGAKIVNTIKYPGEQNVQNRTADVYVDAQGDAKAKVKTTYAGLQYENDHLDFVLNGEFDDQKKWVQSNTQIPSFDLVSFKMTNHKNKVPSAVVDQELVLKRLSSVSNKRLFLTPNLMNRSTFIPEKVESRKTNVVLRNAYVDNDTIRYHLPEGIYPEVLPEPVKITSRFGEYENRIEMDAGSVVYVRRMKMKKGEFPRESYQELIDFYRAVNKADNSKIVFLNKT